MEKINNYLEKFKKIALPNEAIRKELVTTINEELDLALEIKDLDVKNYIAYVKGGSAVRSEIFLNKKRILDRLRLLNKDSKIIDIK